MTVKKYIVMCVGHTHTGKTTFAQKLARNIHDVVIIDNDDIGSFINNAYPQAIMSAYNKVKRNFREPNLKFLISKNIFTFCLKAGLNIIQSSGNLGKDARALWLSNAKKYNYKVITIYFNLDKKIILERISKTSKPFDSLWRSKNWLEVMARQEGYAELPPSRRNRIYFEIPKNSDYNKVLKAVTGLLDKSYSEVGLPNILSLL